MTRLLFLTLALLWAALFVAACGTDRAECGGINSSGTVNLTNATVNCANGGVKSGAGTTDRHDVTDNHSTTGEGAP